MWYTHTCFYVFIQSAAVVYCCLCIDFLKLLLWRLCLGVKLICTYLFVNQIYFLVQSLKLRNMHTNLAYSVYFHEWKKCFFKLQYWKKKIIYISVPVPKTELSYRHQYWASIVNIYRKYVLSFERIHSFVVSKLILDECIYRCCRAVEILKWCVQ